MSVSAPGTPLGGLGFIQAALKATDSASQTALMGLHAWADACARGRIGSGPESIAEGAERFRAASAPLGLEGAKALAVDVLTFFRTHRDDLVPLFFHAVKPALAALAGDLPAADRSRELALLNEGKIEAGVHIELPPETIAAANARIHEEAMRRFTQLAELLQRPSSSTRTEPGRSERVDQRLTLQSQGGTTATRNAGSTSGVEKIQKIQRGAPEVSRAQWGAFLGRVVSNALTQDERTFLDHLVSQGRVDTLWIAASTAGGLADESPNGGARMARIAAAFDLVRRSREQQRERGLEGDREKSPDRLTTLGMALLSKSDPAPIMSYAPLESIKDGDLEGLLLRWVKVNWPDLGRAMVENHPHIPRADQLVATSRLVGEVAAESGRFLEGWNVLTIMHQMGRSVPWLHLLHDRLGLARQDYLGVSVPYSGSKIAIDRMNKDGFETLDDHDPREPMTARIQDTLGSGNPRSFDDLKEEDIRRAVGEMLEKRKKNNKPILIVDDGGYAAKVIRKYFPDDESAFRIVEWTTRGIRQFEELKDPKLPLISGAESGPKCLIEPPFVAESLTEHFSVAIRNRLGTLDKKPILVIGYGNIGRAVAFALRALGAVVTVTDRDPKRLKAALEKDGFAVEPDIKAAVKKKAAILASTGANSLPPAVFGEIDPGTIVASGSSVDIETRSPDPESNGTWQTHLSRAELVFTNTGAPRAGEQQSAVLHPINRAAIGSLEDALSHAGLRGELLTREILCGGYPLNLSRRVRVMAIEPEELILMNVTESMAQAVATSEPGKHTMDAHREERIVRIFGEVHPKEYQRALELAKA